MGYLLGGLALLYLYAKSKGETISQVIARSGVPSAVITSIGQGAPYGATNQPGTTDAVPGAPAPSPALSGSLAPNPACGCTLESPGYQPVGVITQGSAPHGPYAGF